MLVLAFALVQPVAAQSFKPDNEAGWKAYKQKDYATALRHFRPLSEQGNVPAHYCLGRMHLYGEGVTQDYKQALHWYRKTAKQGDSDD